VVAQISRTRFAAHLYPQARFADRRRLQPSSAIHIGKILPLVLHVFFIWRWCIFTRYSSLIQ